VYVFPSQRTPLTLISGPVKDLLAMYTSDTPERRLLAITERNVARLSRLVDMLMDVSRVEAGRMQGTFSPRQLGQLTADLASLFRSAIEKAGLEFIVEWDPEETRLVYVDSDMFEKIVFNVSLRSSSLVSPKELADRSPAVGSGALAAPRQLAQVYDDRQDQGLHPLRIQQCRVRRRGTSTAVSMPRMFPTC
jgi:signal transduction histidine kinase